MTEATNTPAQTPPAWLQELIGLPRLAEGDRFDVDGERFVVSGGMPRSETIHSASQQQTSDAFGYKWNKRETFEGEVAKTLQRWLVEKYGSVIDEPWLAEHGEKPILLDAGCGASLSGIALFGPILHRVRYIGADVSPAVDVARTRFAERGLEAGFVQADLQKLPLPPASVDLIFSEGVLHHTDDTRAALTAVCRHLKPRGRILFYVYRRKGPIREFTDDHIREKMQAMTPQEGWAAMLPLTRLGQVLGDLDIEINVPEAIDLLDIPAGKISLQRLFYWHIFKAFYSKDMTVDEMNHINFDWYAPTNAHRQTPEEIRAWCADIGLDIEHEHVELAGISIIARKR